MEARVVKSICVVIKKHFAWKQSFCAWWRDSYWHKRTTYDRKKGSSIFKFALAPDCTNIAQFPKLGTSVYGNEWQTFCTLTSWLASLQTTRNKWTQIGRHLINDYKTSNKFFYTFNNARGFTKIFDVIRAVG